MRYPAENREASEIPHAIPLLLKAWTAFFRLCSTSLSAFFGIFFERGRPALRSLRFEGKSGAL